MRLRGRLAVAGAAAALVMTTGACGGPGVGAGEASGGTTLTVYNAQHEQLLEEILPGFTDRTGIGVRMRNGEDFELANQLVQEGAVSPADVFLTENSPAMTLVDSEGLFAKVDAATLGQVPSQFAPADGRWVGFAARSTVLVYNTDALREAELPKSIMELADPRWQGRIAFSPAGADFQAIVSAVVDLEGEPAARRWLSGLAANGRTYQGNIAVLRAVNDGQIDAGVIYHYYWYRDRAESGANSENTALHYFGGADAGAFLSISGAGVLASSAHPEEAQQLLRYLTGVSGQRALAASYALEYPLNPAVPANPAIKPLEELDPPPVEPSRLNGPGVVELMRSVGLL